MSMPLMILAAVLLDRLLGEPRRFHPLAGFGRLARWAEKIFYGPWDCEPRNYEPGDAAPAARYLRGIAAVIVLLIPFVLLAAMLQQSTIFGPLFSIAVLYFAIAPRSLREHAEQVIAAFSVGGLPDARRQVGLMVSRDTSQLDES
ncbi:MAG: cobalamin biosynthesis protein, partial [Gallionella sp.]|nr:cobalamin biosynthesis protein [Gallionella sp.]